MIKSVVGAKNLERILKYQVNIDIDGNSIDISKVDAKAAPFQNIGMMEFKKRFVEVMNYYASIKPAKAEKAKFLIAMRQRIFTNYIPVFSNLLRPAYASSKKKMFSYDKLNSYLTSILSSVVSLVIYSPIFTKSWLINPAPQRAFSVITYAILSTISSISFL